MGKFMRIKGLGGGFDGLVVEVREDRIEPDTVVNVLRIIDTAKVVGDRSPSLPLPEGALFVLSDYLDETVHPVDREFASTNPWGRFQYEGRYLSRDDLVEVAMARFDRALQVTVTRRFTHGVRTLPTSQTVFSGYFFEDINEVIRQMNESMVFDDSFEGLPLVLSRLKLEEEARKHGA